MKQIILMLVLVIGAGFIGMSTPNISPPDEIVEPTQARELICMDYGVGLEAVYTVNEVEALVSNYLFVDNFPSLGAYQMISDVDGNILPPGIIDILDNEFYVYEYVGLNYDEFIINDLCEVSNYETLVLESKSYEFDSPEVYPITYTYQDDYSLNCYVKLQSNNIHSISLNGLSPNSKQHLNAMTGNHRLRFSL